MSLGKSVMFTRVVDALLRNGWTRSTGLSVWSKNSTCFGDRKGVLVIESINSKGQVSTGMIHIPIEDAEKVANAILDEVKTFK